MPYRKMSRLAPYLLALFFALAALRGAGGGTVTDTDAARHFMNGAFLHDLAASGNLMRPVEYGKEYYSRLPALSMPYHPPLFPAIEALFFFVFGVKLVVARALVALAVGISAWFLYRLVRATEGSDALAACVTVAVFSSFYFQLVATDVMLEFPAFAFATAALHTVRDLKKGYTLRRALLFALLAAAAVWTKQFTVFLGAVPPLYALLERRWQILFSRPMWISTGLFAGAVALVAALSIPLHNAGISPLPLDAGAFRERIERNLLFYTSRVPPAALALAILAALCLAAGLIWLVRRRAWPDLRLGFYAVWGVTASGVVLLVPHDPRYVFNVIPPAMAILFVILHRAGGTILGERRAWVAPAVLAGALLVSGLSFRPEFLRGPAEAAALVVRSAPARVIYMGDADGNFTAAVRLLDPSLKTTVIQGEKLGPSAYQAEAFEAFCQHYGVGWAVFENTQSPELAAKRQKWIALLRTPAPSMHPERSIPLESTRTRWRGTLEVYRVALSGRPTWTLTVPFWSVPGSVEVKP